MVNIAACDSDAQLVKRFVRVHVQSPLLRLFPRQEEVDAINDFVRGIKTRHTGLVYSGCCACFSNNRIEGRLLATASRLRQYGKRAHVVLAAEIAELLSINDSEPLLENEYLFLPDLQKWPAVFGFDRQMNYRLRDVLEERERSRMPTVVYFEDGTRHELGTVLVSRYKKLNLAKFPPPSHAVEWPKS